MWVLFDWDQEGFASYLADPEVPAIIQAAGHKTKPVPAPLGGLGAIDPEEAPQVSLSV